MMDDDDNPLLSSMMDLMDNDTKSPQERSMTKNPTDMTSSFSIESNELVQSFTNLRQTSGVSTENTGEALDAIERLPHNKLVRFTKDLFNIVETFSMKHSDMNGFDHNMLASISEPNIPRGMSGSTFVRRHRPASGESYRSTASIASMANRRPVNETRSLKKDTDEEGFKTLNEYSVIADLGKGAFAKVKLGQNNETGETVAIKIIKKQNLKKIGGGAASNAEALQREIAVMKKLRHKNIVQLHEVIDDPSAEKLYIIMQYISNGPIVKVKPDFTCEPLEEQKIISYTRQLCSGLRYLHKRSIVHRDIKPDNILVDREGVVYLADFGVSEITQSRNHTIVGMQGTPVFLSPEVLSQDQHADGVAADVWALGVTLHLMLYGFPPFVGRTFDEMSKNIQTKPLILPQENERTFRWREILHGMLEKHPTRRMTLTQLKNHKVFEEQRTALASFRGVEVSRREMAGAMRSCKVFLAGEVDDDGETHPAKFKLKPFAIAIVRRYLAHVRNKIAKRKQDGPRDPLRPVASFSVGSTGRSPGVGVRGLLPKAGGPRPPNGPNNTGASPSSARLLSSISHSPTTKGGTPSSARKPEPVHLPQLNTKRGAAAAAANGQRKPVIR